ncbi:PGF-pre-PGF domain-containing protein [Halogranum amylolyticum]|uniref:PGF-pre-PGF domain-containing protein n=1 Tax=Halogranum amylolyticum TaxID=660520 RepID=A0A1H8N0R9_9EURY|nr:PGF-pre-PGF domain-containing protein [Halogranum amylolyticum]SEO23106.1 PGF-pre-PGF domain-containing protein [Halogranum amylolyticum]
MTRNASLGRLLSVVLVLLVTVGSMQTVGVAVAETTTVGVGETAGVEGGTLDGEPGETATVVVWTDARDVGGYQATVAFDPSVLRVRSVEGTDDFETPVVNVDDEGSVTFNQLREGGVDGPALAELTFEFVGAGGTQTTARLVGSETKLADPTGVELGVDVYGDVTFRVVEPTPTVTPEPTPAPTSTPVPSPTATPEATATPEPTPTRTPVSEPSRPSSGGGGSGSANSGGADASSEPEISVTQRRGGVLVDVQRGSTATSFSVDLPRSVESSGVGVLRLDWETQSATNRYTITVSTFETAESVPELAAAEPLAYVSVTPDGIESTAVDTATVRFVVDEETLTDRDDLTVSLWRYDGSWHRLETTELGDGRYAATTPGFSTFAVAVDPASTPTPTPAPERTPTRESPQSQTPVSASPPEPTPAVAEPGMETPASALDDVANTAVDTSAEPAGAVGGPSAVLVTLVVGLLVTVSALRLLRR